MPAKIIRIDGRWFIKDGNKTGECRSLWHALRVWWNLL
jgi:hypothetical protein